MTLPTSFTNWTNHALRETLAYNKTWSAPESKTAQEDRLTLIQAIESELAARSEDYEPPLYVLTSEYDKYESYQLFLKCGSDFERFKQEYPEVYEAGVRAGVLY